MRTADFLRTLADESVEFVLVGGMAVQLHGYLRISGDFNRDRLTVRNLFILNNILPNSFK